MAISSHGVSKTPSSRAMMKSGMTLTMAGIMRIERSCSATFSLPLEGEAGERVGRHRPEDHRKQRREADDEGAVHQRLPSIQGVEELAEIRQRRLEDPDRRIGGDVGFGLHRRQRDPYQRNGEEGGREQGQHIGHRDFCRPFGDPGARSHARPQETVKLMRVPSRRRCRESRSASRRRAPR